jgi:hypothetical protein
MIHMTIIQEHALHLGLQLAQASALPIPITLNIYRHFSDGAHVVARAYVATSNEG